MKICEICGEEIKSYRDPTNGEIIDPSVKVFAGDGADKRLVRNAVHLWCLEHESLWRRVRALEDKEEQA